MVAPPVIAQRKVRSPLSAGGTAAATGVASEATVAGVVMVPAVWYGAISWIAFTVGDDWEQMQRIVRQFARRVGVVAAIAAGLIAIIVMIVLRRRAADKVAAALVRADSQTK